MLFGKKHTIGLDIGSSCIKAVELQDRKNGYELSYFDYMPIPPGIITDGVICDREALVSAIRDLFRKSGIKRGTVVVGISGHSSVIIKKVTLPMMTDEELSTSISYEAEQYIPFDIQDVNIDFQILGPKKGEEEQMEVIIAAVKKNVMQDYVDAVQAAGFHPSVVDVDSFAMCNTYEANYDTMEHRNIALVNVGASKTNISILHEGTPIFVRDTSIGNNYHVDAFERILKASREDAERLMRGQVVEGISEDDSRMVMDSASDEIYAEIYRSFEYFNSSISEEAIGRIMLGGGAALMKDFPEMMSERIGVPVDLVDPFKNIRVPDKLDKAYISEMGPLASVAVGLALRRFGDKND